MKTGILDWIAFILVIIGGLNWGLVALGFNLVDSIFGAGMLATIVYALVGLSALYMLFAWPKKMKKGAVAM
jgi:uncharacterized membrane protein YuzA (DUF378 family)